MKYFKIMVFVLINIVLLLIVSGMIYTIYSGNIEYPQIYHEQTPFPITAAYITLPLIIVFLAAFSLNFAVFKIDMKKLNAFGIGFTYLFLLILIWQISDTWLIERDTYLGMNPSYISYFGKYNVYFTDFGMWYYLPAILLFSAHSLFPILNVSKFMIRKEFR